MTTHNDRLDPPIILAVYGTLKKGYGNHHLLDGAKYLDTMVLPILALSGSGFPIAKFVQTDSDQEQRMDAWAPMITVELYKIVDSDMLKHIDSLEGYTPNDHDNSRYKRIQLHGTTRNWITISVYTMDKTTGLKQEWLKDKEQNIYEFKKEHPYMI